MALSFSGVRLGLLPDDLRNYMTTFHSLTDFDATDEWGFEGSNIGHLPLPSPPLNTDPPEIGTLYWPTGLSRYASGVYLVDGDGLTSIRTAVGSGNSGNMVISDGTNTQTFPMYLVASRPLAKVGTSNGAYLLHVVDRRYYLRTKTGSITSTPASWSALLSSLASQLGITLTVGTVDSDYGAPTSRWVVYQKPLSVLVDAACSAIGHRLVANTDGTFKTVPYADAKSAVDAQVSTFKKVAGGAVPATELVRSVPASVEVVFRSQSSSAPHTVPVTLSSLSLTEYSGVGGVTGASESINGELEYTGSNASACTSYAQQAATDYYKWNLVDLDYTFAGAAGWVPTGAEDRIEWKYNLSGGVLTRVVRPPFQVLTKGGYENPSTATSTASDDCVGCGWLAGLTADDKLKVTVLSATGRCACGSDWTEMLLETTDGENWRPVGTGTAPGTVSTTCCPDDLLPETITVTADDGTVYVLSYVGHTVPFTESVWLDLTTDSQLAFTCEENEAGGAFMLQFRGTPPAGEGATFNVSINCASFNDSTAANVTSGQNYTITAGGNTPTNTVCGHNVEVIFSRGTGCDSQPCLHLTAVGGGSGGGSGGTISYYGRLECCSCCSAVFAFGGSDLCTDPSGGNACNNLLRLKVECLPTYTQSLVPGAGGTCCGSLDLPKYLCLKNITDGSTQVLTYSAAGGHLSNAAGWFSDDDSLFLSCGGFPAEWTLGAWGGTGYNVTFGSASSSCPYGGRWENFLLGLGGGSTNYWAYPWDADSQCAGPLGVLTDANAYRIPRTLTVAKLTGCTGITGTTTLTFDSTGSPVGQQIWSGFLPCSSGALAVTLTCNAGTWSVAVGAGSGTVTSTSYGPFLLDFSYTEDGGTCCPSTGGTATFVIHE